MNNNYQVAIVGGGPGGYVAAIRLNQLGVDTILFEKEKLGGVCLNYGCIPTKTLVANANLFEAIKNSEKFGIKCTKPEIDWEKIQARKTNVVTNLVKGLQHIFSKRKIEICSKKIYKISSENNSHKLYFDKKNESFIEAKFIIIATGSGPKQLPNLKFDHKFILSSKDILSIEKIPKKLAIIGGGVIGCEFASIFKSFGSEVEIVEFMPNLISIEDEEISKKLGFEMKKRKIQIHLNTFVKDFKIEKNNVILNLSNQKKIIADKVLICIGRKPLFDIEMNSDKKFFKNKIFVDEKFQTNIENIFAIGDVIGKQMLAHTASKQAILVASYIKNLIENREMSISKLNYENIPRCIFTEPEIGCVGLTESEARKKFNSISIGKFMFRANGKALAIGKESGFVKTIFDDETKKLIGLHILGFCATELIAQGAILINSKISFKEIEKIVFAHPTLSETIHEAILDSQNLAIHKI